jgi:hypothetical protein
MKKTIILSSFLAVFVSCNNDDDNNIIPDPDQNDVVAPVDYTFTRNNESTVSFSGQTTRILMAQEIVNAFKDVDNATETSILAMYNHQEDDQDFSDPTLNGSDKSVRSKTAASKDYFSSNTAEGSAIKATFDSYIVDQTTTVFPNWNELASAGASGQIADGSSTRYISAKGLEYDQAFAKGLIGGLMTDQILNNYLSPAVLDAESNVENNNNGVLEDDKSYTTMEHKWDEAYGYLFGKAANASNPISEIGSSDNFLNKYVGKVDEDSDFEGIAQDIFDAFKLGRAAIVANNYIVRDEQAAIIQEKISQVIAIRTIYYLQNGKNALQNGDLGGAFHDLSEGYGFIKSLRFTRNTSTNQTYFTGSEVDGFIADLMNDGDNGFWDLLPATLDTISEAIAAKFSFTVAEAASTN